MAVSEPLALPEAAVTPRARWQTGIALAALSSALALVALEGVARGLLPAPRPWHYPQLRYRPAPAVGFGLVPDQRAFTADQLATINRHGLRGPLVPYARRPGRLRLLFLGDSIVFGYGVADHEAVSARVAALLAERGREVESINAGVPSYNTTQEVAYLAHEGIRYAPDWVIVGVCWNDLNDKSQVRVSQEGFLVSAGDAEPPALGGFLESPSGYALRNALKRSRLLYGSAQGWRGLRGRLFPDQHTLLRAAVLEGRATPEVEAGWARVATGVARLRDLAERRGFGVVLATFPPSPALTGAFPASSYTTHLRDAASGSIPLLDLAPAFRAAARDPEALFIPYDADHPNAAGHEVAARSIVEFLTAVGA
jgi:lysophospholipase L1-like esterase